MKSSAGRGGVESMEHRIDGTYCSILEYPFCSCALASPPPTPLIKYPIEMIRNVAWRSTTFFAETIRKNSLASNVEMDTDGQEILWPSHHHFTKRRHILSLLFSSIKVKIDYRIERKIEM